MPRHPIDRRELLKGAVLGSLGAVGSSPSLSAAARRLSGLEEEPRKPPYTGPNLILVRFGGGVRRRETIDPAHTFSPYFLHELVPRGTLFPAMEIAQLDGVETSHGQGTLYILTGRYDRYTDVRERALGQRFEAKVPTLFEYLRRQFEVPEHETLIVNGEDRTDEEFYAFSNHHLFGVDFRSSVLSLYRFKTHLLRRRLASFAGSDRERVRLERELARLEAVDHRSGERRRQPRAIEAFWDRWRRFYGDSGLRNPRGDRLLTELALRALRELRPKLMMVNYNDPDYVHWGNPSHYTRGIGIIDRGLRQLVEAVEADEEYRDRTLFVIVPDCGRDDNRALRVPFQHHFAGRASREIFALVFGPGVAAGQRVDRAVGQIDLAATVGELMGFATPHTEGAVLAEALR